LYAGKRVVRTEDESSVLENPNAAPVVRIIGGYHFSDSKSFIYGTHYYQTYKGSGDPKNTDNWTTTKTCQLARLSKLKN